jgi:hypothetical protein
MNWISVKDRLPDDNRDVCICCHYDLSYTSYGTGFFQQKYKKWEPTIDMIEASNYDGMATIRMDEKVTHWCEITPPIDNNTGM